MKPTHILAICSLLAATLALPRAEAVRTQSETFEGYNNLSDGKLEGVALHWDGSLGVGPSLGNAFRPPQGAVIWDIATAPDGSVYLATGGPGAIYRLNPSTGDMKQVLDPDAPLVRAVHVDEKGNLYAGSSPDGRIYRIPPDGGFPEVYATLDSNYVWAIGADPAEAGAIIIAAGVPGRLYRIPAEFSPGDAPEVLAETENAHVTAFAQAEDGTLFYGTGPGGHLVEKQPNEKPETLVELGRAEVREIFPLETGGVRIALFRSSERGGGDSPGGDPGDSSGGNSSNPQGLPSGIFEVNEDGFVDTLLIGADEKIFSAALVAGELLIGTDTDGRLYRFADRFDWSLLGESKQGGEVSSIEPIHDQSAWVATSNPAAIYQLSYEPDAKGTFVSEVFDAEQKVRWGALISAGIGLDGVEWETRTGNRSDPDSSWGDWQPLKGEKIASAPGRFFQFRGKFNNLQAIVRRVEAFYQLPNEAPVFRRVEGIPVKLEAIPLPPEGPGRATLPQLFGSKGNAKGSKHSNGNNGNGSVANPFVVNEITGWLSIVWEATDPNHDDLRFRVYLRSLDQQEWFLLGEDLDMPFLSLNVSGFKPGYYEPRIVASDRMSNPPDMAKTSETRGQLILIDNQPPEIVPPTTEAPYTFTVRDNFSIITAVSYRLEGSEARSLLPSDGIFDSREEVFELPHDAGKPGASLFLEATDARGNQVAWTGLVRNGQEAKKQEPNAPDKEPTATEVPQN